MFVSANQIIFFLFSFGFGCFTSIPLGVLNLFIAKFNNKFLSIFLYVIFFFILSILFFLFRFYGNFPNVSFYMIIGFFLGMFLFYKILLLPIAKLVKKVYNKRMKKGGKLYDGIEG